MNLWKLKPGSADKHMRLHDDHNKVWPNTRCKSKTRTADDLFEGASCCFQLRRLPDQEDVCCPLCRGVSEIPLQHAGTFLHVVASKPLLSWSLRLSGWSSFQATCLFIVIVSLSLLSSSLCLGGAHLWRPPLAHTPGVIRCHGSAWLPEPLFKRASALFFAGSLSNSHFLDLFGSLNLVAWRGVALSETWAWVPEEE